MKRIAIILWFLLAAAPLWAKTIVITAPADYQIQTATETGWDWITIGDNYTARIANGGTVSVTLKSGTVVEDFPFVGFRDGETIYEIAPFNGGIPIIDGGVLTFPNAFQFSGGIGQWQWRFSPGRIYKELILPATAGVVIGNPPTPIGATSSLVIGGVACAIDSAQLIGLESPADVSGTVLDSVDRVELYRLRIGAGETIEPPRANGGTKQVTGSFFFCGDSDQVLYDFQDWKDCNKFDPTIFIQTAPLMADNYLIQSSPTSNGSTDTYLLIGTGGASSAYEVEFQYDMDGIKKGLSVPTNYSTLVNSASLLCTWEGYGTQDDMTGNIAAYDITGTTAILISTWAKRGPTMAVGIITTSTPAAYPQVIGSTMTFDLTTEFAAYLTSGASHIVYFVNSNEAGGAGAYSRFASIESATPGWRPLLRINYTNYFPGISTLNTATQILNLPSTLPIGESFFPPLQFDTSLYFTGNLNNAIQVSLSSVLGTTTNLPSSQVNITYLGGSSCCVVSVSTPLICGSYIVDCSYNVTGTGTVHKNWVVYFGTFGSSPSNLATLAAQSAQTIQLTGISNNANVIIAGQTTAQNSLNINNAAINAATANDNANQATTHAQIAAVTASAIARLDTATGLINTNNGIMSDVRKIVSASGRIVPTSGVILLDAQIYTNDSINSRDFVISGLSLSSSTPTMSVQLKDQYQNLWLTFNIPAISDGFTWATSTFTQNVQTPPVYLHTLSAKITPGFPTGTYTAICLVNDGSQTSVFTAGLTKDASLQVSTTGFLTQAYYDLQVARDTMRWASQGVNGMVGEATLHYANAVITRTTADTIYCPLGEPFAEECTDISPTGVQTTRTKIIDYQEQTGRPRRYRWLPVGQTPQTWAANHGVTIVLP